MKKTKPFLSHGRHYSSALKNKSILIIISKMVFKRSQKSQLKILVSRFHLFGEHNRSIIIIVENYEHKLEL